MVNRENYSMSDEDFFSNELRIDLPDMELVSQAMIHGDYVRARREYATYLRSHLQPERFFMIPYEAPGNDYQLVGETEQEAADRICTNRMVSCGTPYSFGKAIDWRYNATENEYWEWPWQLNRHNEWKFLAHLYRKTGDERYATCVADQFSSWMKQSATPEQSKYSVCWRTIECGIRMGENWPYTLHAFVQSPMFTDDILVDWVKSVVVHGKMLRHQHKQGNWLVMEMNGLAHLSILFPELAQAEEWQGYALRKLNEELSLQIYPDGFQYELSTNYHEVVVARYHDVILLANIYQISLPKEFLSVMEKALEIYVTLSMPDGGLPDLNDGSRTQAKLFLAPKSALFPSRTDFLWIASDGTAGEPPTYTSVALPYSGFLVMRESWEKDASWAIFDAAPFGRGHQHEDMLSLTLFSHGKLLLTEGGNYAYDTSEMRKYVLSTRSHNTVRVDDQDQNRRQNYHWAEKDIQKTSNLPYQITPHFDFGEGTYRQGYGENCDQSVEHQRRIIFIKQPEHGLVPFFLVIDRLFAETAHSYEILWHLDGESIETAPGKAAIEGLQLFYSEGISGLTIVYGQKYPQWQGWVSNSFLQEDYRPVFTLKCLSDAQNQRIVTLLYPCDTPRIKGVMASNDVKNTLITLSLDDGTAWTLDEHDFGTNEQPLANKSRRVFYEKINL